MIRKISLGFLALLLLSVAATYFFYSSFRSERLSALESMSQVAETTAGPIEYQIVGEDGPFVLFLHGTPGGYDQAISVPGYRVLATSRPGYLRTPLEAGKTPAEQAQACAALLTSLNIDKVVVMGASGGGPSALSFASEFPEKTVALIAIEAVSQFFGSGEETQMPFLLRSDFLMWATLSVMERVMGPEGIVKMLVPDPANQRRILNNEDKIARIGSLLWSTWPVSRREAGTQNDFIQFATLDLPNKNILAPTLIIHGTEDTNVPFDQSEKLASQIPGAVLHVIEGGDHMMPFSHAEEVDGAVLTFLAELDVD